MRLGIRAVLLHILFMQAVLIPESHSAGSASEPTVKEAEQWRFKAPSDTLGVLGPDLFGESTDHENGSTGFKMVDIDLPGNSGLPVQLVRERKMGLSTGFASLIPMNIGNASLAPSWQVKIPSLSGTFVYSVDGNTNVANSGWTADSATPQARCSTGYGRPAPVNTNGAAALSDWWGGVMLDVPGQVNEALLYTLPGVPNRTASPARWTTKSRWLIDCLPTLVNGSGEGFIATAPNGDKYTFNRMVVRTGGGRFTRIKTLISTNGLGQQTYAQMQKGQYFLVATKVEDRFGNYVNYNYNASNQLTSIVANDGRTISLTYDSYGRVASAVAHGKTWTYEYASNTAPANLTSVTLPDSKKWLYAAAGYFNMYFADPEIPDLEGCGGSMDQTGNPPNYTYTVTHPSGAVGTFNFSTRDFYNPWNYTCAGTYFNNVAQNVESLVTKTIAAPGAANQVWTYQYVTAGHYLYQPTFVTLDRTACLAGHCPTSRTTTVTGPDGTSTIFTFRLDDHAAANGLVRSEISQSGVNVLKSSQYQYVAYNATNQSFALRVGVNPSDYRFENNQWTPSSISLLPWGGLGTMGSPMEYVLPQIQSITVQDGVTYTNQVNAFDSYARSIDVTRSNSNGFSKTEHTQYSDDTTKWVLGQLTSVTDVASGQIEQAITYHSSSRLIATRSKFGQLLGTFTWHANGTLLTAKDAKNNTTTLSNYKAGNPQRVDFADGSFETGVLNEFGWLSSMTNARGYSSSFTYDNVGRLTGITPPTGEGWAATTLTFTPLTTAIYGVPVGGWKHTISRGNYRKETYMDALYRPLVVREYDNANATGTQRFSLKSYDTSNREVFSSYPGISSGLTVGSHTTYDALGRVIENKADSEMGVLTTTTQYLTGGGIKVTGPDGNNTTRTFRSLDAPSYDQMISEAAPGGVTTSISRDVFGKPLTITRSGTDGLTISKQFAYDSAQRLCMRTEPETGTSIIDYDAAGNVLWGANGQAVANPAVCDRTAAVASAKINYTYDALNRVTKTDDPSSTTVDPTVTYYADGSVNTLTNGTAVWTYTYNKLGKPVTESLNLGGKISTITHAYDTLSNEASLTYPSGTLIAYTPNALGQATQAGTYATAMTYRASGFLSGFTYGNAATYSALPNLRGLPARRLDKKGTTVITDELMAYDQDANPVCVRDTTTGNPGSRDFTYDARDRLIKASAPNQAWISSEYQYNSQDNIKLARLGTRQYNYSYNNLNRLADIGQPATAPVATNFGLLSCSDYALLTDINNTTVGGSGSGGSGTAITISPSTLPNGTVSQVYSQQLSSSGGTAPYTYALTVGTLPVGLSLSGSQISGTPSSAGNYSFTINATDSLGNLSSNAYVVTINPVSGSAITINPGILSEGEVNIYYSQTLTSTGGTGPYTYQLTSGTLPLGLSLPGATITGTPTKAQLKTFTITSTDSLGNIGTSNYSISIISSDGGGGGGCETCKPQSAELMLAIGDTLKYDFTYDANGRMLTKGTQQSYVYDALNRMTQVTSKESYVYDGHGRRVQVTKTSDGIINYPLYSLDGKLLVEDNRQTLKRTEYIYTGGRLVAKKIQPITATGTNNGTATITYIHTDFLGSPVAETNSTGAVTKVERFSPYGEAEDMVLDAGPGFTGHASDVLTGLTYMQQRYYDAEIGRFISPDPVGPEEDFVKHFNRYNYSQNNPVRYTDPDGRSVEFAFSGGTEVAGARILSTLMKSATADSEISVLSRSDENYTVSFNQSGDFGYNADTRTVNIDVSSGLVIKSTGETQSPAMGAGHEISHAAEHDRVGTEQFKTNLIAPQSESGSGNSVKVTVGISPEEKRATNVETKIGKELGQPTRQNYHDVKGEVKVCVPTEKKQC